MVNQQEVYFFFRDYTYRSFFMTRLSFFTITSKLLQVFKEGRLEAFSTLCFLKNPNTVGSKKKMIQKDFFFQYGVGLLFFIPTPAAAPTPPLQQHPPLPYGTHPPLPSPLGWGGVGRGGEGWGGEGPPPPTGGGGGGGVTFTNKPSVWRLGESKKKSF